MDTVADYEGRAREILPADTFPGLFDSDQHRVGRTNRNNLKAFAAISLRPRVMVDVTRRSMATTVQGQTIRLPIMVAPASGQTRFHADGEVASVRAAGAAGTVFVLSTLSSRTIEEVASASSGPMWFQLYFLTDRSTTGGLIRRAQEAGYSGLVLTVDNKTFRFPGGRGPAVTNPPDPDFANFRGPDADSSVNAETWSERKSTSLDWADLAWIRSVTSMPIIIKGIQTADDAALAVEHGVDGLVVSNHGGWALYDARGSAATLPEVVDAVGDRLEVYLDGGVRHGTDVLKALALGAKAVLVGRPTVWGLAADGETGVRRVLEILGTELDEAMGLCGVTDVAHVDAALVRR